MSLRFLEDVRVINPRANPRRILDSGIEIGTIVSFEQLDAAERPVPNTHIVTGITYSPGIGGFLDAWYVTTDRLAKPIPLRKLGEVVTCDPLGLVRLGDTFSIDVALDSIGLEIESFFNSFVAPSYKNMNATVLGQDAPGNDANAYFSVNGRGVFSLPAERIMQFHDYERVPQAVEEFFVMPRN